MRKFAQTFFRSLTFSSLNPMKSQKINFSSQKLLVGTGLTTFAFWFSTNKYLNAETLTFETEDNLQQGQVRQIKVGPKDQDLILVINYQGKIYCTQSKCSHFGFNLAKGLLIGDKLICPLHNAAFNIKSGHQEQGPVYGGLKNFPVQRKNGKIIVTIPKQGWDQRPPARQYPAFNLNKDKKIVIIGGGAAALSAVDSLRSTGYDGMIYMVSKQKYLPYDRTALSKGMDNKQEPTAIRNAEWFDKNRVVFLGDSNVTGIDYKEKKVNIQKKQALSYDKVLIASGCVNKVPPIKGLDQVQYSTLRHFDDYKQINKNIRETGVKNITIIGGGFIGMETASAIKLTLKDQVNITVIQSADTPLKHVLGQKVGKVLQNLSQKNGINVITSAKIQQISSKDKKPSAVVLQGKQIPTDVLIMATGVRTSLDFAQQLIDKETNGVKTNVFLQTKQKNVYAAGDVASYPYWYTGKSARIEHFNEAIYQGSVAGMNMAGKKFPMDNVPFFWTRQFNNSLVFTGVTQGWDDIHIVGSLDEMKFIAYYINKSQDKILGAAAMGMMNKIQIINQAMKNGVMPKASQVKASDFKLDELLKDIKTKNPKCTRCGL